jgi:sugar/nucleoside kinase (ribokinase family)
MLLALAGDHDLGRNESRPARLLDVRDYCKLHIVAHYPAVLLGAGAAFEVLPVGKVGDDDAGGRLRAEMAATGMDIRFVETVAGSPTLLSVCFQYPDGSGGNLTTTNSAAAGLTGADVERVAPFLDERTIALAAPEVPLGVRHRLLKEATARRALRVAAVASAEMAEACALGFFAAVDLLALNEDEASALTGLPFDPGAPWPLLEACASRLTLAQPAIRLVVSAGPQGAFGFANGRWAHSPALDVEVTSTAGAGDALLGGLLAALAAGAPFTVESGARSASSDSPLASALDFGVLLAAFKVVSPHTIHPDTSLDTLLTFADDHGLAFAPSLRRLF